MKTIEGFGLRIVVADDVPASQDPSVMSNADQLIEQAEQHLTQGNALSALSLFRQAIHAAPSHPYANTRLAELLIEYEQHAEAATLLERALESDQRYSPAHLLLGRLAVLQGQAEQALKSFDTAIRHDNGAWGARMEKARLLESLGRMREASLCWTEAVRSMPAQLRDAPQMEGLVNHARAVATSNLSELRDQLRSRLSDLMQGESDARLERFRHALDIVTGQRQFITANPLFLPIPRLPAIPYFDRTQFDWAPAIEAATPDIRNELLGVMDDAHAGFIPYVQTRAGDSSGQFSALDGQSAWSAYFLWKHGKRIDTHCSACPVTAQVVEQAPLPRIRARAPAVFFSRLDPGVHIPPHNGATNARLTVHLPLIVPDKCAFRVGDETRQWKEGELLIFDDTILHEAWNGSDRQRVVMIFDIWHPMLSMLERELVTRTVEGLVEFYGGAAELGEL